MPQISGPYTPTPTPGVPIVVSNPAQGGGNLVSSLAVIVNISPYELVVSSGASSGSGLVDPFTRDGVSLDPTAGEQIVIMPLDIGFSPPDGVDPTIYVLWYLPTESAPTALPAPIVPYGNLQSVDLVGQPIDVNVTEISTSSAIVFSGILTATNTGTILGSIPGTAIDSISVSAMLTENDPGQGVLGFQILDAYEPMSLAFILASNLGESLNITRSFPNGGRSTSGTIALSLGVQTGTVSQLSLCYWASIVGH